MGLTHTENLATTRTWCSATTVRIQKLGDERLLRAEKTTQRAATYLHPLTSAFTLSQPFGSGKVNKIQHPGNGFASGFVWQNRAPQFNHDKDKQTSRGDDRRKPTAQSRGTRGTNSTGDRTLLPGPTFLDDVDRKHGVRATGHRVHFGFMRCAQPETHPHNRDNLLTERKDTQRAQGVQ